VQARLPGRSVLIVENEPLLAMDMAGPLAEAIEKKQAELDAAEEDLRRHTGTLEDQMTTKFPRVGELQREVIDLEAKRELVSPQCHTLRSLSDNRVHLICRVDEAFADLPDRVRHLGPWQAMSRGDIAKLKPEYRLALTEEGYALVKCELAVFKPEV
jgi:hypothetical protein